MVLSYELYTLHLVENARGSFIDGIRNDIAEIFHDLCNQCFSNDIFKGKQTKLIIDYVEQKYHDELEYLWKKFPDNAIIRRKDSHKWYALIMTISTNKLGVSDAKIAEVLDLRINPDKMKQLINHVLYFPGWHMNKKSWYTIILDGSLSIEEIYHRIDISYQLAK